LMLSPAEQLSSIQLVILVTANTEILPLI
jgi:hypothetical protein